mgnify:CR=1 FL=1
MKMPSINRVMVAGVATAQRFPATITSALVAAWAGMMQVAVWETGGPEIYWLRVMAVASLGLPLFTGITLLSERHGKSRFLVWLGHAVGLGILLLFYVRWPDWSESTLALRYFHLSATIHFGGNFRIRVDQITGLPMETELRTDFPWVGETYEKGQMVRQAMSMAIDRHALNDEILGGQGCIAYTAFLNTCDPHYEDKWADPYGPEGDQYKLSVPA